LNKGIYYGYWLIGGAFFAQFIALGMYSYVLGAFMIPMIDELGWSRADFTLTRSIGQLVMAVVGVFVGARVDRYGGRPIMLIGATILTISLAAHAWVETLWEWWLLNGIALTMGCAMLGNLVVNITLSKWFVINRGKAVAWAAMGVSFGGIVITPWITWVIDEQGWRTAWLWLAVFAAVFAYPVALMMRRAPEHYGLNPDGLSAEQLAQGHGEQAAEENRNAFTRAEALRSWSFYGLVTAFGFFAINIVVMLLQAMPYMTDNGFTRSEAVMAMIVASVPAMLSKPVWGYLIDRMQVKPLAAISASVTGIALFLIVAAVNSQQLILIYLAFGILGLGWGGMIPMQEVIWARFFGRLYIGAIRGAAMPFALTLGAVAPWAVSYYHDMVGSYDGALLVVATLNVISGVLIFIVPRPQKSARIGASKDSERV
jgi:OFA family oxalate/formate antiporter-like MFS transporter